LYSTHQPRNLLASALSLIIEGEENWRTMKKIESNIQVLNDLIKINSERVEHYKLASYDSHDSELKSVFSLIADESRKNITDISKLILKYNDSSEFIKPVKVGRIYRSWVEIKSKFNGTIRNSVLNSCEFGEMAALDAYAMAKAAIIHPPLLELIERQRELLTSSLDVIKSYRMMYDKFDKANQY